MRTKEEIQGALDDIANDAFEDELKCLEDAIAELYRLRAKLADREGLAKLLYEMFCNSPVDGPNGWTDEMPGTQERYRKRADQLIKYLTAP